MNAIETKSLTKYYGRSRGIVDVDLTVEQGELFGFIGPNGAGKSTLIRTLLGLISPTSGSGEIFGGDIVKNKIENLSRIGYLPSETSFWSGMKAKEVIELSAKMRKLDCRAEAALLCERLDLDPDKKIGALSFGNRKKVGIVCALQHKQDLYIFDEPTGGLDPLMQKEFYDIIKERNQEGATVFLSSHILSEIGKYCTRAAVIRDGKILVADRVDKLIHTGVKKVSLRGVDHRIDLAGAEDMTYENGTLNFLYRGDPHSLFEELKALSFEDINIIDPDLDEIFMHYYAKEAE